MMSFQKVYYFLQIDILYNSKIKHPKNKHPYQNYNDFGSYYDELNRHYLQKGMLNFGTIWYFLLFFYCLNTYIKFR